MLMANTQFEIKLKELVEAEIQLQCDLIAQGLLPDFAAYKFLAGKIEGLRTLAKLCDEANSDLAKH